MDVVDILREGVGVALKLGAPLLLLSMLVGILVAIFQAVTQIHEQSLSFILKMNRGRPYPSGGRAAGCWRLEGFYTLPVYPDVRNRQYGWMVRALWI